MCRRVAGFETAALVDGHVHQHRAGAHAAKIGASDQLGRRGAGYQHATDDQIGGRQQVGDQIVGGKAGLHRPAELIVQFLEPGRGNIEQGDVGALTDRHLGGVLARNAAAEDQHPGRQHAGRPAQQQAAPALWFEQVIGADIHGHPASHLAHRGQQRQSPELVGDGFVGDGGAARFHQAVRLIRVGGEVQIGKEDMVRLEPGDLDRLRLLHLDDQFSGVEYRVGVGQNGRADIREDLVGQANPRARAGLDEHLMALMDQPLNHARRRADAKFKGLDLLGNADAHRISFVVNLRSQIIARRGLSARAPEARAFDQNHRNSSPNRSARFRKRGSSIRATKMINAAARQAIERLNRT